MDPSFGAGGVLTLSPDKLGYAARGVATADGGAFLSGGSDLRLLGSSGAITEPFGSEGALGPPLPADGEFRLGDFTVDSEGRLLVVGTARFPTEKANVPLNLSGGEPLYVPSVARILRFLPDGRLDPSFGQGGVVETEFGLPPPHDKNGRPLQRRASLTASGIAVNSEGKIAVTGGAEIHLGYSCEHDIFGEVPVSAGFVARLDDTGALDPNFSGDGIVGGRRLTENPLRAETIGGPVIGPNGAITYTPSAIRSCEADYGRWGVAQLTPAGRTRKVLGKKGAVGGYFTALAGEGDGSVIALARMGWTEGEAVRARIVRIGPDGKLDRTFGRRGNTVVKLGSARGNELNALAIDPQGRILVGGTFTVPHRRSTLLIRLRPSGHQETNFGANGRVTTLIPGLAPFGPSALFLDAQGRIVTIHRYEDRPQPGEEQSGLALTRYLSQN